MKNCSKEKCIYPQFGGGFCKYHQYLRTDTDKRSAIQKHFQRNLNDNEKKNLRKLQKTDANIEMVENVGLLDWFLEGMKSEVVCENCGASNPNLKLEKYKKQWRSCQAHLLPKRHFISIRTHPLNRMVLGTGYSGLCNCHDEFDSNWDKASKMNIFKEVVRRFKILYPLIPQVEHKYIPQQLLSTINT